MDGKKKDMAYRFDGNAALASEIKPLRLVDEYVVKKQASQVVQLNTQRAPQFKTLASDPLQRGSLNSLEKKHSRHANFIQKLLSISIALSLVFGVGVCLVNTYTATQEAAFSAEQSCTIHVMPGDTLWSLAQLHPQTGKSTQETVAWIKKENHLVNSSLKPGQTLRIPLANN